MQSRELLLYFSSIIDKDSMCYSAAIPSEPRRFLQVVGDEIKTTYERGILLSRRKFRYNGMYTKSLFIFEPLLWTLVRRKARHDSDFASRLNKGELTPDDIESLISTATNGIIALHMKGRTIYDDEE